MTSQIIDLHYPLFSNLLFRGAWAVIPKCGKKRGIKGARNSYTPLGVPSDIKFTSAATNDSFMLKPST